jgi:hypothetical protein
VAIVADNAKEAKRLALGHDALAYASFIDIVVKWHRDADILGLTKGEVPEVEGLKRGLYAWIMGDCPTCKKGAEKIEFEDGIFSCERCRGAQ